MGRYSGRAADGLGRIAFGCQADDIVTVISHELQGLADVVHLEIKRRNRDKNSQRETFQTNRDRASGDFESPLAANDNPTNHALSPEILPTRTDCRFAASMSDARSLRAHRRGVAGSAAEFLDCARPAIVRLDPGTQLRILCR